MLPKEGPWRRISAMSRSHRISWGRLSLFGLLSLSLASLLLGCQSAISPTPTPPSVVEGSLGQELKFDRYRVTVDRTLRVDFLNYQERTAAAQGRYLVLLITVCNDTNRANQLSLADFLLLDTNGQYHQAATSHHLVTDFDPSLAAGALLEVDPYTTPLPGFGVLHTALVFDLPRDARPASLSLYNGRGVVKLAEE